MLQIEIDNKDGFLWDLSGIVSEATYKTTRAGQASSFEMTLIKGGFYESGKFKYDLGDIIRVRLGGHNVFYGYIFSIDSGRDETVKITAYDQIRYLLANDTYHRTNITATALIQEIAKDFKLKVGKLDDTKYQIPKISESNSKLLDIICKALTKTLIDTKKIYVFFDDFGELSLRDAESMTLDIWLGDTSLVYDYKQKRSLDKTSNYVKISQENKKNKQRTNYILQDSKSVAKWGLLQHYQTVDENVSVPKINEMLDNLLKLKNREQRTFQLDALGDIRLRAGCYVLINIQELGVNKRFLVNECTHKFNGSTDHTMSLDLIDIDIREEK
ncbi:XkdQ/YqbQ family protein [Paenibacillus ehimensis]|uniref:XkdQ/YqbQ family protein n=1 Tax=Paenibacillus ehimensis TaxID=79264 RepID=UPI00046F002A|nr:hypothetical protein [Paenibacillus ehimensis]